MTDERVIPATCRARPTSGSARRARVMRITPLDLRQPRFRTAMRGFDKTEVVAFLTEAADDYESALRENDRLRRTGAQRVAAGRASRARGQRSATRCVTAQKLADEIKAPAQNEAQLIVREAKGRADLLLQKAQARLEDVEREHQRAAAPAPRSRGRTRGDDPGAPARARVHPRSGRDPRHARRGDSARPARPAASASRCG